MRKILTIIVLLATVNMAQAGTLTVTASGFTALPASAPANWPPGIAWPGTQSPNGSKTYTINDADWQALLTWTANNTVTQNTTTPTVVSAAQILLNWLQIWINGTKTAVQQFNQVPATVPPPITIQ